MTDEPTKPLKPLKLHKLVCEHCHQPITKGQAFAKVRLPDGDEVPVHGKCMK